MSKNYLTTSQNIENSIICTTKSISTDQNINIKFDLDNIDLSSLKYDFFQQKIISLPKITYRHNISKEIADLLAIYRKFHKNDIHSKFEFKNINQKQLFDNFEQFRLILKGSEEFKGIGINLTNLITQNIDHFAKQENYLPFLLLNQLRTKSPKIKHYINIYQQFLTPKLKNKINDLIDNLDNQKIFSEISFEIIRLLENKDVFIQEDNFKNKPKQKDKKSITSNQNKKAEKTTIPQTKNQNQNQNQQTQEVKNNQQAQTKKTINYNIKNQTTQTNHQSKIQFVKKYQIFTKEFDEIVKARDLSSKDELVNLRTQLDNKIKKLDKISNHLSYKLKRKLLCKKDIFQQHNKEEGIIDRKKISRFITSPSKKNNYLEINQNDYQDTVICLLLDNSGSMRGNPIIMSALSCEIITQILERFSIKTEILGFTTSSWHGGRSRKSWEESSKPKNPGRLSDIRHIIYKNADQPFKKSRINLGLMLKEGLLKENIDGEALIWAKNRLIHRNEKRKILIVISDGTPIDDSTNSNNENNILSDHLHQVIVKIQKHSEIEIAAIGIGHEVNEFYHNSITINNIENLGDVLIDKICDLL